MTESKSKASIFVRHLIRHRALLLMLMPTTIYLFVNNYMPIAGLVVAFKEYNYSDGLFGSPWSGFENFRFLFASQDAWLITRNTLLYSLAFLVVNLVCSVIIAVALNELRNRRLAKWYQTIMIMPYFLSFVIISYLALAFLNNEYGFINNAILKPLGLEPIEWYSEPKYWPYLLIFINAWKAVGIGAVVYLAAIAGIDPEYYEAAFIDGANRWQQIKSITLPTIKPVIIVIAILNVGNIFTTDFGLFYQVPLDSGILYDVTQTIDTYVYRALLVSNDIGMSSAANFYQSWVGFVMVILTNWVVRQINKESALF